ncbi:DUF4397 domain-containing protein [Bacillus coahuilensis]|uniref:DUF4397 domain-containing protein n=1 Tax=Bacillus coahuilensis TaxID=408580 RepID=UPI000313A218|nr:DUF4397 domain-containing protein [Bacillus coahuilensis]
MMNESNFLQLAIHYDVLAKYYKYTDPTKHIFYYQKHLESIHQMMKDKWAENERAKQPAYIRILHAAPTTSNVDVFINSQKVLTNVPYKGVSNYITLPGGSYHIDIYPTGNQTDSVISKKIVTTPGMVYTLAAIGETPTLQLKAYLDQPSVPANETKVKFIHLSPTSPTVDIAVKNGDVIFPTISYKQATNYLPLSPMTVDLEVRIAGSKKVALPLPNLTFKPNESYTIVAVGFLEKEPILESILLKG